MTFLVLSLFLTLDLFIHANAPCHAVRLKPGFLCLVEKKHREAKHTDPVCLSVLLVDFQGETTPLLMSASDQRLSLKSERIVNVF